MYTMANCTNEDWSETFLFSGGKSGSNKFEGLFERKELPIDNSENAEALIL